MIAILEVLGPRSRVICAWAMIVFTAGLICTPVVLSAAVLVRSSDQVAELRRETDQLADRVDEQASVITQWYLDHAQTPEDVIAYGDPERSQRQFEDQVDRFAQALIDAGVTLTRSPAISMVSRDDGVVELRGDIAFSGRMREFVLAVLVEDFSHLRVGEFEIISVRGQPVGRIRGNIQLRQFYILEREDDT
jgi:hypothetical protein